MLLIKYSAKLHKKKVILNFNRIRRLIYLKYFCENTHTPYGMKLSRNLYNLKRSSGIILKNFEKSTVLSEIFQKKVIDQIKFQYLKKINILF